MLKLTLFVTFGILLSETNSKNTISGKFGKKYKETIIEDQTVTIIYTYLQVNMLCCCFFLLKSKCTHFIFSSIEL